MGFFTLIKKAFGFDGVSETALKIVDKIAGTDWTPQQRADFILKHAEVTKYQSPTRRFIALAYTLEWLILCNSWLVSQLIARVFESSQALLFSKEVETFMSSNINLAMSGILAFYFLTNLKK